VPTTPVEQAVRGQFGPGFRPFGTPRRRRNELEFPHLPEDNASTGEAAEAVQSAQRLITAAGQLLPGSRSSGSEQHELNAKVAATNLRAAKARMDVDSTRPGRSGHLVGISATR
jgi:hypothetical protein